MTTRPWLEALSVGGVITSIGGAFSSEELLTFLGAVATFLVHLWTRRTVNKAKTDDKSSEFWHTQADRLSERLWRERERNRELRASIERMAFQAVSEPAAVTPPAPPAEAST